MARPKGITDWRKGKTYEEIYGIDRAQEMRRENSLSYKGKSPWNKGLTVKTDERIAQYSKKSSRYKGEHHTEGWKDDMSRTMQIRDITWGDKISEAKKGVTFSPEHKRKLHEAKKLNLHDQLVIQHCAEFEGQGFRCIPLLKHSVLPDIIAIKDLKIYAIEVERGRLDPRKYENVFCYDDIIWILYPNGRRCRNGMPKVRKFKCGK